MPLEVVTVKVEEPLPVIPVGLKVAVTPAGNPLTDSPVPNSSRPARIC